MVEKKVSVWPDSSKYCHFGKKVFVQFLRVYLFFRQILNILWQFYMSLGKFALLLVCQNIAKVI